MQIVTFTDVYEFKTELQKDASRRKGINPFHGTELDHNIVRITMSRTPTKISPNLSNLSVISTYSARGQIIRLNRYCGGIWGEVKQDSNEKIIERADKVIDEIESLCKRLNIECRAGIIEATDEKS